MAMFNQTNNRRSHNVTTDLSTLQDDGDILVLDENHRVVLKIEHDPDSTISDYDGDGWTEKYSHEGRDRRDTPRPSDMDGRAMKLDCGNDKSSAADWIWWQPYDGEYGYQLADGTWTAAKWSQLPKAERDRQVERVTNILRWGFSTVGLVWEERATISGPVLDEDDLWIETGDEWMGGVDLSADYGLSIGKDMHPVTELFEELHLRMAGVRPDIAPKEGAS